MFDNYAIVSKDFKNVKENGQVTGFQLNARLPYYRGLGLSMVEDIQVTVDGESFGRDQIKVTLHGITYTLDQLETELVDRWEFGEVGTLTVAKPGGLSAGDHLVELREQMRISYRPMPLVAQTTQVLAINE